MGFTADNIYVIKVALVERGERFGEKIGRKVISRWENIEIDDEFGFWLAEQTLREGFTYMMTNYNLRLIVHEKGKMLVDGLGAKRIIEERLKHNYIK